MRQTLSQNEQLVYPSENDIQAENKVKGRLSLLSVPQWTETRNVDHKMKGKSRKTTKQENRKR